jgi:AcrR family transcriptional regulator
VPSKSRPKKAASRVSRANGRATAERILKFARHEITTAGPVEFNIDRVLRKSKVSRSSLYHHFTSREGLITALEFERAYKETISEMELIRNFVLNASDLQKVFDSIEFALIAMGEKRGHERRRHRIETLAAGIRSPALQRTLADAQVAGSNHFIETLQLATEKQLIAPTEPLSGIAYVIQSLFVGRILVDLTGDSELDKAWVTTTMSTIKSLLIPGTPPARNPTNR